MLYRVAAAVRKLLAFYLNAEGVTGSHPCHHLFEIYAFNASQD